MFSRLLIVRLKTAERALKDGRLDEAFRLATAPDLREHRRGAALLAKLTDKFIERARAHFADERFTEALGDLDKAEAGGVQRAKIVELRRNVRIVANEVQRQEQSQRRRIEDARQRVAAGSLAAGQQILAAAGPSDADARQLAADINARERQAAEGFDQVEKMLKDKQLAAAIERFKKVKPLSPQAPEAAALESTICAGVVATAKEALQAGRINRAAEELAMLGDIGRSLPARRDMEDVIELARSASQALDKCDFESARRHVLRLQGLWSKVGWINKAADQLEKVDEILTSLYGGPLGENAKRPAVAKIAPGGAPSPTLDETVLLRQRVAGAAPLPNQLLLLVDGGGSYLLLRQDRSTVGRAMTRNLPDIPIRSDLAERHAEIARVQDDYFLFSSRDIDVDGRPTRHHLLRNGNRVSLARNARFTFRMPHRQSPSGLLEMSSATHMPGDVRRVVLFRGTAMIGLGKSVHIMCNSAVHGLILFERAGQLWIRPQRNGRIDTEATHVELGKQMELFNVSFVVQPWKPPTLGPGLT